MNDDDVLEALAEKYREQLPAEGSDWERVVRGRLTVDQALATADLDEDAAARAAALFTPLDAEFEERLATRLADGLARAAAEADAQGAPVEPAVVIERPRRFWRGLGIAAAIAAAAAVVLFVRGPDEPDGAGEGAVMATALPRYSIVVQPGAAATRTPDDAAIPPLVVGEEFGVLLRPAARHPAPARAALCLERGAEHRVLDTEQAPGQPGETLDVRAHVPEAVAPGPWTLVAVVSSDPLGPDPCAAVDGDAQRVERTRVELRPPP